MHKISDIHRVFAALCAAPSRYLPRQRRAPDLPLRCSNLEYVGSEGGAFSERLFPASHQNQTGCLTQKAAEDIPTRPPRLEWPNNASGEGGPWLLLNSWSCWSQLCFKLMNFSSCWNGLKISMTLSAWIFLVWLVARECFHCDCSWTAGAIYVNWLVFSCNLTGIFITGIFHITLIKFFQLVWWFEMLNDEQPLCTWICSWQPPPQQINCYHNIFWTSNHDATSILMDDSLSNNDLIYNFKLTQNVLIIQKVLQPAMHSTFVLKVTSEILFFWPNSEKSAL